MKKALKAVFAAALLATAATAGATPSTTFWTPATTYSQPYLVPHITYDTYVAEKGFLANDYGLTVGVLPFEKLQGEVGIDLFYPGISQDNFYLNGKLTLPENAFSPYQPALSVGAQSIGFKKDYSNYNHYYAVVAKTFPVVGNIAVGGYYGGNKVLYATLNTASTDAVKTDRAGFMASWTSADINIGLPGLNKIVFLADYASGKNAFGAVGGGIGLYFTPTVDILTGPVWFNDKDGAKAIFGSDFMWSVQLDVDFDLIKKKT